MESDSVNSVQKIEQKIDIVENKVFNTVAPSNLPSFFDNLKATWTFFWTHKQKLFLYFFVFSFLLNVFSIVSMVFFTLPNINLLIKLIAGIIFIVGVIFLILWDMAITSGSANFLNKIERGENPLLWASYKEMIPFIIPILFASVVSGLSILSGVILFVVPGIILSVCLSFTIYFVVLEKKKTKEAMLRSFTITKGRRPYVFFQFLGTFILVVIVMGILNALVGEQTKEISTLNTIKSVINLILNAVSMMFIFTFSYVMYGNLKKTEVQNIQYEEKVKKLISWLPYVGIAVALLCVLFFTTFVLPVIKSIKFEISESQKQEILKKAIEDNINIEKNAVFEATTTQ